MAQGERKGTQGTRKSNSPKTNQTKKTGTKKNTGTRQNTTRNTQRNSSTRSQSKVKKEVLYLVGIAIAIFLEISNFGLCGIVGKWFSGFLFGLVGIIQYVLPVAVLAAYIYLHKNQGSFGAIKKVIYCGILGMEISMFAQLIAGLTPGITLKELYLYAYEYQLGGGIICGGIANLLHMGLGSLGSYLVLIVVAVIMIVLLTEKSLIHFLQQQGLAIQEMVNQSREQETLEEEEAYGEPNPRQARGLESVHEEEKSNWQKNYEAQKQEREAQRLQQKEDAQRRRQEKIEKNREKRAIAIQEKAKQKEEAQKRIQQENKARRVLEIPNIGIKGKVKQDTFVQEKKNSPEEIHEITMTLQDEFSFEEGMEKDPKPIKIEMPRVGDGESKENILPQAEPTRKIVEPTTLLRAKQGDMQEMAKEDMPEQKTSASMRNVEERAAEPIVRKTEEKAAEPIARKTEEKATVKQSITAKTEGVSTTTGYTFPPYDLLHPGKGTGGKDTTYIQETMHKLQMTLDSFGVKATITDYSCGPSVTRFELQPEQGVKVSKIVGLADDIKLNLAAADIRIEAPIPGKAAVGIEIPNKENNPVVFRELIESDQFKKYPSEVAFAVGKDIAGQVVVANIAQMPHLLIAGATGSGKSVCINTIIMSILYKANPEHVKLIMIDPKVVELSVYNGIPHLLIPVVTDPKKAAAALNWAVVEMTKRYQLFAEYNVRNLKGYNKKVHEVNQELGEEKLEVLPEIVIIVDELADLMMVAHGEVEDAIVRLAQLARAAGLYLIIATQRPSVDVITGLIKANIPSRIAFAVASLVDSRTILDMAGAEKLLGKGDMLFAPREYSKPARVQGAFVSDDEVSAVVEYVKAQAKDGGYNHEINQQMEQSIVQNTQSASTSGGSEQDEYFVEAARLIIQSDKASIGMLQRKFKIGFNRAARIMDQLADEGIVGPEEKNKPRTILMSEEQFEQYLDGTLES